jgi:hypothetical protein
MQKLDDQDDDQDPPCEGGGSPGASVGPYAKTNRQFRSTTDPDATLVRQGGLKSRPFGPSMDRDALALGNLHVR